MLRIKSNTSQSLSIPFRTPEGVKTIFLTPGNSIEVPDGWTSKIANNLRDRRLVRIIKLGSEPELNLTTEEIIQKTKSLFEGGEPGGGEPGGGAGGGAGSNPNSVIKGDCWEVMVAHISFLVEAKIEPSFDGKRIVETGKWRTEQNLTVLNAARALGGGRFGRDHLIGASIYKQCVCLTSLESGMINGVTARLYGVPYNEGGWRTRKNVVDAIEPAFGLAGLEMPKSYREFSETGFKLEGANLIPPNRQGDYKDDQYLYSSFVKGCSECVIQGAPASTSCECNDSRSVKIDLDDQSKTYTASNGEIITFTKPGDRKSVIEEVMAAEKAIPLDCNK